MNEEQEEAKLPDILPFYDSDGRAVCYLYESSYFYLYNGTPVAWLHDCEHVYSYTGRWLGWLQNGWLWDNAGRAALFSELASGGPSRPSRQARPSRGSRQSRPSRASRQSRPSKPSRTSTWSTNSDASFFDCH
jgi:hypothetical protein